MFFKKTFDYLHPFKKNSSFFIANSAKYSKEIISLIIRQFINDGCFSRAASLAYTTLLSLVPLLTVVVSMLAAFPVFHGITQQLQHFIFQNFVAASAQTIQDHLQTFIDQTVKLPAWGLLGLLIGSVLLVFSMEQAFNAIWKINKRREGTAAFLMYWGVITFLPLLVAAGIMSSKYFLSIPLIANELAIFNSTVVINFLTPFIITLVSFTFLYFALPNCKVPLHHAFFAAIPTTILFDIARFGFSLYIAKFPTYTLIYGALASIPIFLIWLYLTWLIILFGVEINQVLTNKKKLLN